MKFVSFEPFYKQITMITAVVSLKGCSYSLSMARVLAIRCPD